MSFSTNLLLASLCAVLFPRSNLAAQRSSRPNVLYFVVDDLRPQLGIYGQSNVRSPNIDALGKSGAVFNRAYTQQAICGPSRNSFLTGRTPDSTKTWTFVGSFRNNTADGQTWVTLPQLFKDYGYTSCGMGKTYHDDGNMPSPPEYDVSYSWSSECPCPKDDDSHCFGGHYSPENPDCGPGVLTCTSNTTDGDLTDAKVASHAISTLQKFAATNTPFFLMIGFRRPHIDFMIPQELLDAQPKHVSLAKHKTAPEGMPPVAFFHAHNERPFSASLPTVLTEPTQPVPDEVANMVRRGYYAAVEWCDMQIGRVLAELHRLGLTDNTLVILHSDHGWQLGEHGEWAKETNFEVATRVPLIIRAPWLSKTRGHMFRNPLVSLVDVYRTVAEIAGLSPPAGIEGRSFAKFLSDGEAMVRSSSSVAIHGFLRGRGKALEDEPFTAAFSQFPRCIDNTSCAFKNGNEIDFMGYSVRTADWRYTEWKPWDKIALKPVWSSKTLGCELYSHIGDDGTDMDGFENRNEAADPSLQNEVSALSEILRKHFVGSSKFKRLRKTSDFRSV